ncbi:MAG: FxLYD domain-containing protein [Candidatus Omnitrophica bacterium]|jgi:hypothetical protein|nr:FxLYD domain-containing protein [Candidatus Omnitrophota bacterium]MDD5690246.1 FxLYD domain-containing protein [Candidatus Omnitrophota bacterium]
MPNFNYYHIEIKKSENTKEVVVKGEVINNTDKNYSTVAVRIILYMKNISVANVVFTINGLSAGATKPFEKTIEELDYAQVGKSISRYDVYTETAF